MATAPPLPAEIVALQRSLITDQAPSGRQQTQYFEFSQLYRRIGYPYSSRRLSITQLYEMRTDAILRFAQLVSLSPIFSGKFIIECRSARKAQFIDQALRRILGRLYIQFYESWNFGWASMVKQFALLDPSWVYLNRDNPGGPKTEPVWDQGGYPALVWDSFVPLRPEMVKPVWNAAGTFNGIRLNSAGGYPFPMADFAPGDFISSDTVVGDVTTQGKKVDVEHALWVTNERDGQFGSVWGNSRLSYSFKYWWSYELTLAVLNRSIERKGDPTIVVSFPANGTSTRDGQEVPNDQIAFEIGSMARSGSVLVIPSDVWDEADGRGSAPKWKVETIKLEDNFDKLQAILGYLDSMKFRSMLVSELAVAEGSGGTSSRNVAGETAQRSVETQFFTQIEWDEVINRYMIPQLADANMPELADEPARKVTQAFGEDENQIAAEMLKSLANANPLAIPLDVPRLLERFQVDALEGDALVEWEKKLREMPAQTQPPKTDAKPNGNAGVAETGFGNLYVDARERIELADDRSLLDALPPTKHYEDQGVLAQTRLIRTLWKDLLASQYEDFAAYLERDDFGEVDLAEPKDRHLRVVEAIMSGWRNTTKSYSAVVGRTGKALSAIFSRAGSVEMRRAGLALDQWNPDEVLLAQWVNDNAAKMVRRVGRTTRQQLRDYLLSQIKLDKTPAEISAGVRQHFSGFPAWRADLIARNETATFYNAATLFAAQASGRQQVQELDARHGHTDHVCEHRNGALVSIEQAFADNDARHPRCTLAFRILPDERQFSITYVSKDDSDGTAARVDRNVGVVYLVEGMAPDIESAYLEQVGNWLEATTPPVGPQ